MEAGKQYEKITPSAVENSQKRKETLYSAVISYYQALKNKETLNFYEAAYAREGLRSSGKTYAGEYPTSTHTPDVLFNVAWVSYDAGQYEDAITDFSNFVEQHKGHQAAEAAIHLVMDCYHQMENYEGLISYGKSVLSSGIIRSANLKKEVAQIVQSAETRVVSTMTMSAMNDWENAREDLIQIAEKGGGGAMGEQALNALILTSKDKKDLPTLFDAGEKMIHTYPNSDHTRDTLGILIKTSIQIGQFRMLADYLEQYVARYPKDENTPDFLIQAGQIREGLGQYDNANRNYRQLLSSGKVDRSQADNALFSILANDLLVGNDHAALKDLKTYQHLLSKGGQIKADAQMVVLLQKANHRSEARRLGQKVRKTYTPQMGEQDPELLALVAEILFNDTYQTSGPFFKLQLKSKIDNSIVQKKTKLLESLENGYQKVMAYKSPGWALKACFRANELNREFADFLMNAPVPAELSADQKAQYRNLIAEKAKAYTDKADKYLQTCIQLAEKWEICDPQLASYFSSGSSPSGPRGGLASFDDRKGGREIAAQGLRDQNIFALYQQLIMSSDDQALHQKLAEAYMQQGDFRQSALIVKSILPKLDGGQRQLKADMLNLLGLSHLYAGRDTLAKETFKRALSADTEMVPARLNLAGIIPALWIP